MVSTAAARAEVGRWYASYAPRVYGLAARITGNPDDADDAVHDAFLAAWRARTEFDRTRDPLPWLATITRHKALNVISQRRRAPLPAAPDVMPSAEEEALAREAEIRVRNLVRDEPAFALHVLDGLTLEAVGERLGLPHKTAASRIHRGKQRIRAAVSATPRSLTESQSA
ncbi:MAG TPA: sigma-70 family RNA polymerase sigma factor [Candidatus Limnocylindria bacterium]|jgi:RNA polymerase sigma factor (sigma-70 family)|nr:sigma-70 family RNA polymerase sigma factor [Candidatus Limnocylindria bacterium]